MSVNRGVDIAMLLQQRQPAVGRAAFEDPGIGHVSHLAERDMREFLVPTEDSSFAGQSADHPVFQMVEVIAIEVFQVIGLQRPVQRRGVGVAARHGFDAEDLGWATWTTVDDCAQCAPERAQVVLSAS